MTPLEIVQQMLDAGQAKLEQLKAEERSTEVPKVRTGPTKIDSTMGQTFYAYTQENVQDLVKERDELKNRVLNLNTDKERWQFMHKEACDDRQELQQQLASASLDRDEFKRQRNQVCEERDKLVEAIRDSNYENLKYSEEVYILKAQLELCQEATRNANRSKNEAQHEAESLRAKLDHITDERDVVRADWVKAVDQMGYWKRKYDEATKPTGHFTVDLTEWNAAMDRVKKALGVEFK